MITVTDFNYHLPSERIAKVPLNPRDSSKLMVVDRDKQTLSNAIFSDIQNFLTDQDVLVVNETKVFPARLYGHKQGGGSTDVLLIKPLGNDLWEIMGKNLKINNQLIFSPHVRAIIVAKSTTQGTATAQFIVSPPHSLDEYIIKAGHTPIPPYITNDLSENELRQKYQTIYAHQTGSVAAPTAGLHFTQELLDKLTTKGVTIEKVTLHVGPGTFGTLYPEHIKQKRLHSEAYTIDASTYQRLQKAKASGKRIIAVGTTSCRTIETVFSPSKSKPQLSGNTQLFIYPPFAFQFVDGLITNFHLPKSSLLMLVTAFVSAPNTKSDYTTFKESLIGKAYQKAVTENYRFFSFGDAMFVS